MYRDIPWQLPRLTSALKALRMGRSMFLYRFSVSLYTTTNTFILGLLAPPEQVAFYGEPQRLVRAIGTLSSPITQAIFPRVSYLLTNDSKRAASLASISMIVMGLSSLSLASISAIFAPVIVHTLFGAFFEPAIPLLRILVVVLPFMSLNYVLGLQWMLPLGLNNAFNSITITIGLINLILAPIFILKFSTIGIAWIFVFSDAFVTIGIYIILWRRKLTMYQVWNTPINKNP
jgi:PST family polysaccharide transporter